jgi:hypothetical protein
MKNRVEPPLDPFQNKEFMIRAEKAQPLMTLEYLNSWGNEFLFIFMVIACGFLLLLANFLSASLPDPVPTALGFDVPVFWAVQFPIWVLILAAIGFSIYYNMRRRYIEDMMYLFYQKMAENEMGIKPPPESAKKKK